MNTSGQFYVTSDDLNMAIQEGGDHYRVLSAWCESMRQMNTQNTSSEKLIIQLKRLYKIHKKFHHRAIVILLGVTDDSDMIGISTVALFNTALPQEQREIAMIIQKLRCKTLLGVLHTGWNIGKYMDYISHITKEIFLDWGLDDRGKLVYDPTESV